MEDCDDTLKAREKPGLRPSRTKKPRELHGTVDIAKEGHREDFTHSEREIGIAQT